MSTRATPLSWSVVDTLDPIVAVSPDARAHVLEVRSGEAESDQLALWVEVIGEAGGEYSYDIWFQAAADADPADAVQHSDDLSVVIAGSSVDKLRGATLDLDAGTGGLVIVNPNRPAASPAMGDRPPADLSGDVPQRVMQVLEEQINPAIASHGGQASLVAVEEEDDGHVAYLRLSGGCQGCGLASVTLSQGIEVALRDAVPEIVRVVDVTDHASGDNPYFESAKK